MKGLLLRLSALDADAEAAVRVIAYFDALVEHRATVAALVRATAGLAECACGLELPDGRVLRFDAEGERLPGSTPAPGAAQASDGRRAPGEPPAPDPHPTTDAHPAPARYPATDGRPVTDGGPVTGRDVASAEVDLGPGRLWLERPGGPAPLDELVLERASIAARILMVRPHRASTPDLADPALVELVLSGRETAADRTRALRLLGLEPHVPVRVLAVADDRGRNPGAEAVALVARGRPVRSVRVAVIGGVAAVLLQRRDGTGSPADDLRAALRDRAAEHRATEHRAADSRRFSPTASGASSATVPANAPGPRATGPAGPHAATSPAAARGVTSPAGPHDATGPAGPRNPAGPRGTANAAGPRGATGSASAGIRRGSVASGIRVGVGGNVDGLDAETSWAQARLALRFATTAGGPTGDPGDAVVDHDALGPLALLAEIPTARLRDQPDVRALDALARTDSGALDVAALEAFCRTGSLRQAAAALYLHHSSVAARLAHVEDALGWHLDEPGDRFRAQLALWARKLATAE
ncbi:helix-turn-helix domain-containing protein [Cryptosporangium aurantiacum]|uniref:PucR C-terminal helix-turn-helix domain-containing protein n=1 Tax=Cryptosporangium aurantiacum TaxID=134849 RepID=A0A1M7H1V2_9ACTN|nr:helix-turn-helix domain-containing protein [Cryptosporangium aurantiacum]SHM22363.1 PucR C-terminal helix-turn-helix domain-containing protein [Cryptosporangium aurantiacum]